MWVYDRDYRMNWNEINRFYTFLKFWSPFTIWILFIKNVWNAPSKHNMPATVYKRQVCSWKF